MENIEKKNIMPDKKAGEAGAYAEKPFRDSLIKYQEGLSEEGKKALEMIAEKEGNEAIKAFEKTKSLEDPRVEALRALAERTIQLPLEGTEGFKLGELGEERRQDIEATIKRLGVLKVEKILVDKEMDMGAKKDKIQNIGPGLSEGVLSGLENPHALYEKYSDLRGEEERDMYKTLCEGAFVLRIIGEDVEWALAFLNRISEIEDRPPHEIIQEYLPILTEAREKYPETNLDKLMLRENFIYSPTTKSYLYLGENTEKERSV